MIIYHGSTVSVETPKILKSERMLDFGEGFYTTFNYEQAVRWSERVAAKRKTDIQIITEYEFGKEKAGRELAIISFDTPDEKWLDFVYVNRMGKEPDCLYDIAIGPVANDTIYSTLMLYEQGVFDKEDTIKRLKVQELFNQILFHTEKSLMYCHYQKHYEVGGN